MIPAIETGRAALSPVSRRRVADAPTADETA
jgi:hypothetical protein